MTQIKEELVLSGRWLYAGSIDKNVHIIKSNFKAGSGDYQDPPSTRDDEFGVFYGVIFVEFTKSVHPIGGCYDSLKQAKEYASSVCESLVWGENEESI
ncbi:hypothetical protein ISG33_01595 [Glaciecola sp. MH2013]|uniref:hypothetical protein n=1 Tax=Glaciecola sp. MH2013 TaxID=2785524 RepID=UPI00189DA502|nr:hypothetical protein [Glaciecola sp. MH2013]MBF7072094.1 hypothetical protein [Glaciecola sp. MH2013]